MVEVTVVITTPAGCIQYSVMVPGDCDQAAKALGSAVELGCALLDAPYRKDVPDVRLGSQQVQ